MNLFLGRGILFGHFWAASILVFLFLSLSPRWGVAGSRQCRTSFSKEASAGKRSIGPMLNVFPTLMDRGLDGIRRSLAEIRSLADGVLLGPLNEQTLHYMPDGRGGITSNNVGYWVKNHMEVAAQLGGETSFRQLILQARRLRFKNIWVDKVYGHLGYVPDDIIRYGQMTQSPYIRHSAENQKVHLGPLQIDVASGNEVYFDGVKTTISELIDRKIIRPLSASDVRPAQWAELESLHDPKSPRIMELWQELSSLRLHGLHGFNHQNPLVVDYLAKSLLKFLNMGATGFRMDAALYVHPKATAEIVNQIHLAHPETKFLFELLVGRAAVLHRMISELESLVARPENLYFLDFPQAFEIRRIHNDPHYRLSWYLGFLQNQNRMEMKRERLLPTIVNHDFGEVLQNPLLEQIVYGLTEFTHTNSSLNFPHTNLITRDNRFPLQSYHYSHDTVGKLIKKFHLALRPYRAQTKAFFNPFVWYERKWVALNEVPYSFVDSHQSRAGDYGKDVLLIKVARPGRQIYLYVNKSNKAVSLPFTHEAGPPAEPLIHYATDRQRIWTHNSQGDPNQLLIQSEGTGLILFELNSDKK